MNEDQIRELMEKFGQGLEDVIDRFGSTSGELTKGKKSIDDFVKSINRQTKSVDKDLKDLALGLKTGTKGYKDQRYLIDKLNDAIEHQLDLAEETADAQEKELRRAKAREMQEKKLELERQSRYTKVGETLQNSTKESYKSITNGAGAFITGLQNGGSSAQLAAGIFTTGIDVAANGLKVAADGALTAGSALLMLPTPVSKLSGALLMAGGTLLEFVAGPGAELAKFGIGVLAKQIDMVVESYDKVLAAGGGFATGLDGLTNTAKASFLTVNQFSKVIEQNSHNIAMAGLGFTETMNRLSAVQKRFGDDNGRVRKQLMNLGYSFEEQASLVLETMADMRRGGTLARASDAEIERQTMDYAKNLRIIAQITGDDAKKRMADARTQMQNMAIQQKMLEMQKTNPEAFKKLQAQLATMPVKMQAMYLQKLTLGTVVDPVSAVLMAQVPQIEQAMGGLQQVLEDNTKNADDAAVDAGKQRALMRQGMENNIGVLGTMGKAQIAGVGGIVSDTAAMAGSIFDEVAGQTAETAEKARENVEASMNATGKLTEGMRTAATAAQQLAIDMQERLLPLMGDYAKVTEQVMYFFNKMIAESGIGQPSVREESWKQTVKEGYKPGLADGLGAPSTMFMKQPNESQAEYEQRMKDFATAENKRLTKHDAGGTIAKDGLGIVGEKGPELVGGPASVLSRVDTEKLMVVLDAMRELSGNRFNEIGHPVLVGMQAERWDTLRDRVKGFENFSREQIESILKSRPEMQAMMAAKEVMGYDKGGNIPSGKLGMVGERGPEVVTDRETAAYLRKAINSITLMMSGLKQVTQEQNADLAGSYYSGTFGGDDFKLQSWAGVGNAGMYSETGHGARAHLEEILADYDDPEKRRKELTQNDIEVGADKKSITQDVASNEYIKNLAENSVRMLEELKRVSNAMSDNNRMTSGILQNTY